MDEACSPGTAKQSAPLLAELGEQLRQPIRDVLEQVAQLTLSVPDSAGFLPDLSKIAHSAAQLDKLVEELFAPRLDGELDLGAFSATIRHDLRTPVNAILGYSEMLLEDAEVFQDEAAEAFSAGLQQVLSAGRRLLGLINELLYFVQEEPARQALESVATELPPVVPAANASSALAELQEDASLLIIDDKESNRDLLSRQLARHGFQVTAVENGLQGLEMLRSGAYDLLLLDVIMPEMNGYQVLAEIRQDETLRHIPVIMISALDEIDSVVRCIEMGAQDYLQKPFNPVILKAKINASLERKRLHDLEQAYLRQLQIEQEKSEKLLLNILPKPVADRLKQGERVIADSFPEATVLFADLVNFSHLSASLSPSQLVERLNEIFLAFDILAELYGLEKIKTIGDAYMLVGGLPTPRPDHAEAVAEMALDMLEAIARINRQNRSDLQIRVGIHTGPVVAGVIGKNKFNYDLWGDAVNTASRMESHGVPGRIQVSQSTYRKLARHFSLEKRGLVKIKGKGEMITYLLKGKR
jgi:class 3 adenylate cyclase/CheY-like chemotaxis protein